MNDTAHEQMLETLVAEREQHRQILTRLRRQLVDAEQQDQRLEAAIVGVRGLLPGTPFVPVDRPFSVALQEAFSRKIARPDGAQGRVIVPGAGSTTTIPIDGDGPRRVPSTEWVTTVVLESGRAMRRDEVLAAVTERFDVPESWTDPQASIGVALQRAASRGALSRTGRGLYAPPDWVDSENENEGVAIAH